MAEGTVGAGLDVDGGLPKAAKRQAGSLACPQVQEQAGTHAKGTRTPLSETIGHKDTLRPPPKPSPHLPSPLGQKIGEEKNEQGRLWFQNSTLHTLPWRG